MGRIHASRFRQHVSGQLADAAALTPASLAHASASYEADAAIAALMPSPMPLTNTPAVADAMYFSFTIANLAMSTMTPFFQRALLSFIDEADQRLGHFAFYHIYAFHTCARAHASGNVLTRA